MADFGSSQPPSSDLLSALHDLLACDETASGGAPLFLPSLDCLSPLSSPLTGNSAEGMVISESPTNHPPEDCVLGTAPAVMVDPTFITAFGAYCNQRPHDFERGWTDTSNRKRAHASVVPSQEPAGVQAATVTKRCRRDKTNTPLIVSASTHDFKVIVQKYTGIITSRPTTQKELQPKLDAADWKMSHLLQISHEPSFEWLDLLGDLESGS